MCGSAFVQQGFICLTGALGHLDLLRSCLLGPNDLQEAGKKPGFIYLRRVTLRLLSERFAGWLPLWLGR